MSQLNSQINIYATPEFKQRVNLLNFGGMHNKVSRKLLQSCKNFHFPVNKVCCQRLVEASGNGGTIANTSRKIRATWVRYDLLKTQTG